MKEYFNNQNTLILMLFTLLGLSILDFVLRVVLLEQNMSLMPDFGGPFVTIILSALLLYFAHKKDERLFYLVCGGWLIYFFISQIFNLPGALASFFDVIQYGYAIGSVAVFLHLVAMVCLIIVGCLLVDFMKDGNVHNDAFNLSCFITLLVLAVCVVLSFYMMVSSGIPYYVLATLNALTEIVMVFLFTYFVYDTAKAQLSKFQF